MSGLTGSINVVIVSAQSPSGTTVVATPIASGVSAVVQPILYTASMGITSSTVPIIIVNPTTNYLSAFALSSSYSTIAGQASSSISSSYAETSSYALSTSGVITNAISSSYSVTASYSVIAQSALEAPQTASYSATASYATTASYSENSRYNKDIVIPISSYQNANMVLIAMPSGTTEHDALERVKFDFQSYREIKLRCQVVSPGNSGSYVTLEYSPTETSWNNFSNHLTCSLSNSGIIESNWISLTSESMSDIFIRWVSSGGDNNTSPSIRYLSLGAR